MIQIIRALYKKEMLDILRDKKTILVMILIPLVLYPLLMFGSAYVVTLFASKQETATYKVAFEQIVEQKQIEQCMKQTEKENGYRFKVITCKDWKKELEQKDVDVCVTQTEKEGKLVYEIQYVSSINASSTAASHIKTVLEDYRETLRKTAIKEQGLDVEKVLYPIDTEYVDRASDEESLGSILGSLVPLLMIISILMGAIYPAIDATAGEKERGTLETLLTLPVTNFQLIMSKFLAVSTVATVSAVLNLLSMTLMGGFFYSNMSMVGMASLKINGVTFIPAIIIVLLCVVGFAMFMSAICLCICIFAKSFKEAQNYSTPLLIVVMLMGYIGFIPDISLNSTFAIIPVANVVLLVKDIFMFRYDIGNMLLVLATNVIYSFLAVMLMSKIYNSESLLFGEGGSLHIFESRKNLKKGQMPSLADASLLLAVSMLLMLYVGSVVQMKLGAAGVAITQAIFLVVTLGFAWYIKIDYKKLFSLKVPKVKYVIASFFLWAGTYLLILVLSVPLAKVFPESASELQIVNDMFASQPDWLFFFVVALCPAICEELLFRGFLFGTFKERMKPWCAILLSGVIFGVYHMSMIKAVTISILGVALAYSVYVSGSIALSAFMHFCNNAIAVCMTLYPEQTAKLLPFLAEEDLSPGLVLGMVGAALICIGFGIILFQKKKKKK